MIKKFPIKLKPRLSDGLMLQLHYTVKESEEISRRIKFTSAAFQDGGERLSCSDHRGNAFIFDLLDEKYWALSLSPVRVLSFIPRSNSILLASNISPYNVHIINSDTEDSISELHGHTSRTEHASYSYSLRYILTSSRNEIIIWETVNYTKYYMFNTIEPIEQIEFAPITDNIVARRNRSLEFWKRDTFEQFDPFADNPLRNVSSFTFTINGRALIVAESQSLIITNTDTWETDLIKLDEDFSYIKCIQFLPDLFDGGSNRILLILCKNAVHLYDMQSLTFVHTIPCQTVLKFVRSINGKHLACILQTGEVDVYKSSIIRKKYADRSDLKRVTSSSTEFSLTDQIITGLTKKRLKRILLHYNEYPEKYREIIWKVLLDVPNNKSAYDGLNNRPIHPCYQNIEASVKIKNDYYMKHLQRLASCLTYWCPTFAQCKYMKLFIFPFLKLFYKEPIFCFEAVATIISNSCQNWFSFVPLPPVNILATIENALTYADPKLIQHLVACKITAEIYAWKILKSAFSEVLLAPEWMILWDHVLSNDPAFVLIAAIAYNIVHKTTVLSLSRVDDFKRFYISQNPINMKTFIKKCYELMDELPDEINPLKFTKPFRRLEKGDSYPQLQINPMNVQIK